MATVFLICVRRTQNSSRYTSQNLNTLLITFGDCTIESEHGSYKCVITKPKQLKDKNLIHDRETPAIFKFSAKNFDTDFNSTRQSEHLLMNKFFVCLPYLNNID